MNMREKMRAASQSFQLLWLKLMQNDPPAEVLALANLLAMQMKCTDWVGLYRWFESIPLMRRWLGDRKVKELKGAGHQVTQDYFESTIGVQREDVRYDKLGGYMTAIEKLANEIKLLPWRQAVAVLADGFSGTAFQLCFDGLPLFSAEHSTGSNTSTLALSATNLATAKKVMRAQADPETGDSLLIEPTHLWYHTDLEPTAIEIVEKEFITAGESNPHWKTLKRLPVLGLPAASANWWGLFSFMPGDPLKAIMWQYDPDGNNFVALDRDTDERNFMRRQLLFGVESIGKAAPAFPQYAWGSTGAGG